MLLTHTARKTDHTPRFRWASMQLQHLCSFRMDADIRNVLGHLPPDLHTLYNDIYNMLVTAPGAREVMLFKNVLNWLLCARKMLNTDELLAIVSIDPRQRCAADSISRDLVLEICNNFVVFDAQLDTFRFAHLSVREFLERRSDYDMSTANSVIAETCLWSVLSVSRDVAAEKLFAQLGWPAQTAVAGSEELHRYADIYWAVHCKEAGKKRNTSALEELLKFFLSNGTDNSCLALWSDRLRKYLETTYIDWELRTQLEDTLPARNMTSFTGLFVACVFDFIEEVKDTLDREMPATPCTNQDGRSFMHVATKHGSYATLDCLLQQRGVAFKITEEEVKAAAANEDNGKEVMALLLDHRGAEVVVTEEVVKAAAGNNSKEVMALLLDQRSADIVITEEVLKMAAGNYNSKEVIALLLNQRSIEVVVTEEVVKIAAGNNSKEVMALLLNQRGAEVIVTEEVVKAAAANEDNGKEVIALLLDQRSAEVVVTEGVVKAAAGNYYNGREVIALLLNQRSAEVVVTEEVVKAAAGNYYNGREVIALLLDQRSAEVVVTEGVVKAAAGNYYNGRGVIALLLDQRSAEVVVTEEVVKAAARNPNGREVMALLLDQRGAEVIVTEDVVKAAAANEDNGKEVMALLLDQRSAEVVVTEEVVKAAARNLNGREVMALLLDQRGAEIIVTEDVVKAAAANEDNGKEVMALLLNQRSAEVVVTEDVVKAAAANEDNGKEVMALLLDHRGAEVVVTEGVIKAAAGNYYNGREVMALLLDQRGAEVVVTEEVVKAAAGNEGNGKEVMALLLEERSTEVVFTEEVIKVAAANKDSERLVRYIHHFSAFEVTNGIIEAAATSGQTATLRLLDEWAGTSVVTQRSKDIARLCAAAKRGDAATVLRLVKEGIPPDEKDIHMATPLWHAAFDGHKGAVQVLLSTNAVDVNAANVENRTPLFWSAAAGYVDIVELLLDHGASQDYVDADCWSPLAIADLYGEAKVVDILVKEKVKKNSATLQVRERCQQYHNRV
jgi:hypothetical protein